MFWGLNAGLVRRPVQGEGVQHELRADVAFESLAGIVELTEALAGCLGGESSGGGPEIVEEVQLRGDRLGRAGMVPSHHHHAYAGVPQPADRGGRGRPHRVGQPEQAEQLQAVDAGLVQVGALFVGGLVLSIALLTGGAQLGGMLYLLAQLVAVALFVVRIVPLAVRVDWAGPDPRRHVAAASLWVVAALVFFMYLVSQFVAAPNDPDLINRLGGVLVASDHAVYIGVISNLVFAVIALRLAPPATTGLSRQLMFWGLNAGLLLFAAGLVSGIVILKQIGAPLMGLFLLHNLAVYARALLATRRDPDPEPALAPGT